MDSFALFLTAVSRLLRIYKAANSIVLGDTDVSRKIISIISMLIILIYISSGVFIVIENIGLKQRLEDQGLTLEPDSNLILYFH
jgi:hypothetical protein